jgi:hypothetical protein
MRGHAEGQSIGEIGSATSRIDTVEAAGMLQVSWLLSFVHIIPHI